MAKVIGADAQRALSYNLSREEERRNAKDSRAARSRLSLGEELTRLSMDSDVDDPSLGYLAGAMQADPTGIVGGIAQAFGNIQRQNAMRQKRTANSSRAEMEAKIMQDNLRNLYGSDEVDDLNKRMDPEGIRARDPGYWSALGGNLKNNKLKEEAEEEKARKTELERQQDAEFEQKLEQGELANAVAFSNYTTQQKAQSKAEREEEIFENAKGPIKSYLKGIMGDDADSEQIIEWVTTNPQYLAEYFNKNIAKNISDSDRASQWDHDPFLQERYPDKQMFVNLKQYSPVDVQHIVQRAASQAAVPEYQNLSQQLYTLRSELGRASFDIASDAEKEHFPQSKWLTARRSLRLIINSGSWEKLWNYMMI